MTGKNALNSMQRQELFEAIMTRCEIPHKFAYLDNGATAWDAVSKDHCYDLGKRELSTLKKFMKFLRSDLEENPYNILHIGPGNGIEIPIVVDILGIQRISLYALIDISSELLKIAEGYAKDCFKDLTFLSFVHDVAQPDISKIVESLRQDGANRNLILLIANGAILSNSPVLTYIKESMIPEDRLFITLETYSTSREKQIIEQYKLPSIIELFAKSLSFIGICDPNPNQFEFLYKDNSMVEVYFLTRKWLELHPNANLDSEISLPEKIKVFSSFRPTPSGLKESLIDKGFEVNLFRFFKEEKCCGVLCSRYD